MHSSDGSHDRLGDISTNWTLLRQAHEGTAEEAVAARALLMNRYGGAVRRYLRAGLRDDDAADDLSQEFALAFTAGRFRGADPTRGRFRDYVKTSLFNLVRKHRGKESRRAGSLAVVPEVASEGPEQDAEFDRAWRRNLLDRAWNSLGESRPEWHDLLRLRADHPEMRSAELATEFSHRIGKAVTADNARQQLHRARELFAQYLIDGVAHSLHRADRATLEEELRELNLFTYCRDVLDDYGDS